MYLGKKLVWQMKRSMVVFSVILVISFLTFNAFADETGKGIGVEVPAGPLQMVNPTNPELAVSESLSTVPKGALPVYRFNNTAVGYGDHFYTIDLAEAIYIINHYSFLVYEGIAYYAYVAGTTIDGTWNLRYDWDCNGSPGATTWVLNPNGTFSGGTWLLTGNLFQLTYTGGTTVYTGTATGNHIDGTMTSTTGPGCFQANK